VLRERVARSAGPARPEEQAVSFADPPGVVLDGLDQGPADVHGLLRSPDQGTLGAVRLKKSSRSR